MTMKSREPEPLLFVQQLFFLLLVFKLLVLLAILTFCAVVALAQYKPLDLTDPLPPELIPPDILHVNQHGCHIDAHRSEPAQYTLNAKTGEQEEIIMWWAVPFARYEKLAGGETHEDWEPTAGKEGREKSQKPILMIQGTNDLIPREISDACSIWMKKFRALAIAAHHKAGHTLQQDVKKDLKK